MNTIPEKFNLLLKSSQTPGAEWRSAPFWALNGNLKPEEIRKQIRMFHKNGLGGFYLHARTGLETPYLSEKWFECIDAAVDEAQKLDMEAWLYDEDRFPSGFGGGLITCDPRYRAKGIALKEVAFADAAAEELPPTTLALFAAQVKGNHAGKVRRLSPESFRTGLKKEETLLIFYTDTVARSTWYNDYTYLDTLSVEAVRKFMELTHETYAKHYQDKFGNVIPGIFTDEPRYGFMIDQPGWDTEHRKMLPWTEGLLEEFKETFHYDALDRCPEFFYQVDDADSVMPRVHYVGLMLKFFKRAFWEPVGKWCEEHDLKLTGHPVGEDSLSYQTLGIGSAMQLYEYMEMPGIDLLGEHHRAYQTAKQLSSAANQFGKKRRLVEVYGCTGWDFTSAGIKALGDWLYALGVNYRCEHLAFYSIEGEAKRDYPCPVALQTNTPDTYRRLNDYFARLSLWLSSGKEDRRILLVSPLESAWSMFHQEWRNEEATQKFDREFVKTSNILLANQLDFDYGDEELLARLASVDGDTLHVGEASYKVIVVPGLITIRSTTLELLKKFKASGGTVLSYGTVPGYLDAVKADIPWDFPRAEDRAELVKSLQSHVPVSVRDDAGAPCTSLLHQIRQGDDWDMLFLCNTGHAVDEGEENGIDCIEPDCLLRTTVYPSVTITFESDFAGELVEFDPFTGKLLAVDACREENRWIIRTGFRQLATRTFFALREKGSAPVAPPEPENVGLTTKAMIAPEKWNVELREENVAVIDHFCTADIPELTYVLTLDDLLHEKLDLEVRNFMMPQPWCRKMDQSAGGMIEFHTHFECQVIPEGRVALVLERPELYEITLNGQNIPVKEIGEWHASAWRKVEIPAGLFVTGTNRFSFKTKLCYAHPGLESMFLIGNFGVKINGSSFILSAPVRELALGDWKDQGLPHYPGEVVYRTKVLLPPMEKAAISLPEYYGTPAIVEINGREVDRLLFTPDVTKILDLPAEFELKITITGSMRNTCGPFFTKNAALSHYGPMCYKEQKIKDRRIMPYGLYAPPEILG